MEKNVLSRAASILGLVVLSAATLAACATVSPEEMENELTQLRAEMQENEERVEQLEGRVDDVEGRVEQRMNALEENLSAMEDEFGGVVERLEQAIRFNVPVYFEFDDATVRDQDRPLLERFVDVVEQFYPEAMITVEGFTDPAGAREYNMWLGQQRADAVRDYLVQTGLGEEQLRAVSYGPDAQRLLVEGARGPGEEGWQNRRVVLVIDHNEEITESTDPTITSR